MHAIKICYAHIINAFCFMHVVAYVARLTAGKAKIEMRLVHSVQVGEVSARMLLRVVLSSPA